MIWVIGCRGMLGRDLTRRLDELALPYLATDLECDITSMEALRGFVRNRSIHWIINCSGYTAVDAAEDNIAEAEAVNATGVGNLGRLAAETGSRVVHVSTDYVFDGGSSVPYKEEDTVAPCNAYGRSKARGEILLAEATGEYFIVRTAWLYGVHGRNFVFTMLRIMNERDQVSVVNDQRGSPTYSRDLAGALCEIVEQDSRRYGIYHYTNGGETTRFGFARAIYEAGRSRDRVFHPCEITPVTSGEYPTRASRPKCSVLSTVKFQKTFDARIPGWRDGLARFFEEMDKECLG